jgi:hypothetical protein
MQQRNAFVSEQFPEDAEKLGILRGTHALEHSHGDNPIELTFELTIITKFELHPPVETEALSVYFVPPRGPR